MTPSSRHREDNASTGNRLASATTVTIADSFTVTMTMVPGSRRRRYVQRNAAVERGHHIHVLLRGLWVPACCGIWLSDLYTDELSSPHPFIKTPKTKQRKPREPAAEGGGGEGGDKPKKKRKPRVRNKPTEKLDEVCNNYLEGRCRYGEQCRRQHVGDVPQKVEKVSS